MPTAINLSNTTDREFVISRILNAPRELVYSAWVDPEHLINWWGPKGFTNTFHEIDIKPGGVWRFLMHGPDGTDYPNKIVYDQVIENELLAYSHGTDEDPDQFYVIVKFEDHGDKTKLTMRGIFPTAEAWNEVQKFGAVEGGQQTIDKLEIELAKMMSNSETTGRVIESSRVFKVPVEKVYQAWLDPSKIINWWGPKGFTNTFHEFNPVPAGSWKFIMHGPDGKNYPNESAFVSLIENKKIILDHISAPKFRLTATFEEKEEGTKLIFNMLFETREVRDALSKLVVPSNEEILTGLKRC